MGITIVLVDHTGAERCSLNRVRDLVSTPMVMVVALGQHPQLILQPTYLQSSWDWGIPMMPPGNPARDVETVTQALHDARHVAPDGPIEVLLFTDPALDQPRVGGMDPAIRVRHDIVPPTSVASCGEPRKKNAVVPIAIAALVLGLIIGGAGVLWFANSQTPVATTAIRGPAPSRTATTNAPTVPSLSVPTGRWAGPVEGDRTAYDMYVTLTQSGGRLTGQVSYPSFPCSGTWVETRRTNSTITLTETITRGTDRCVQTGTVTLVSTASTVHFTFRSSGRNSITSVLTRR